MKKLNSVEILTDIVGRFGSRIKASQGLVRGEYTKTKTDRVVFLTEYFIGHSGSTYWRKKDSEKAELFRKIEPYLTFLNVHQLQRQGADIQTKVEELEEVNQSLRNRDQMKDDAIAHLSDQLVALSVRLQDIERPAGFRTCNWHYCIMLREIENEYLQIIF